MLHTVVLSSSHKRNLFECEELSLQDYLRKQASQDVKRQLAACFVLADTETIKGYYTLSSDAVDRTLIPEEFRSKLPYQKIPVTLLGRLARDNKFKGQGIGDLLLADALKRAYFASFSIGSWAVVADPLNDKASAFYADFGFTSLESGRMVISMETIKESLI